MARFDDVLAKGDKVMQRIADSENARKFRAYKKEGGGDFEEEDYMKKQKLKKGG